MTAIPAIPAGAELATLGGGCFWCLEAVFDEIEGVLSVESGYAGGDIRNPSYREVCNGDTGHAEVIRIVFDPKRVSYADLLAVFFAIHDPTTLNRQGNDLGTQYRSVIFYHSDEQRLIAERVMREQAAEWRDPIVTQLQPVPEYFPAEDEHQEYFRLHGTQPYCRMVVAPKVDKFRKLFAVMRKKAA
ncbi:MAG TPA: peptide-methionine (S)-S-oxide reductase MsrA [Burkholderiaceae bacterium]|nr:peptide-methionine (S)-S-oxide reductase MsrA [Burkholderiaceae bacterium]